MILFSNKHSRMKHVRFSRSTLFFLSLFFAATLYARNIRTPALLDRGPVSELFLELQSNECYDWHNNIWVGEYFRGAKKAYNSCGDKVNYAFLYFGRTQFNAQDAFANSKASSPTNPLLATSILGPRVKYDERTTVIGYNAQRWTCDTWRIGVRAQLPYRKIKIKRLKNCGNGTGPLGGQTLSDVAVDTRETINGTEVRSFAYRLDFLSRLPYSCTCLGLDFLIVNYRDPDFPFDLPVTISNQDISNQNGTPVSFIKRNNGTLPAEPFAIPQIEAQQLPASNALATNIPENGRGRFDTSVDYQQLGADPAIQATLFIVPSVANNNTVAPARVIQEQVDELLACVAPTAEQVFTDCGIAFDPQCIKGVGDLDTEVFVGHYFANCVYGELFLGLKWPTGKHDKNPLEVFRQPLGNNGHYEFKIGVQALWDPSLYEYALTHKPCSRIGRLCKTLSQWLVFKADITVFAVNKATEKVAASFRGATVKNIGPCVPASISWNYMTLHADVIITPPSRCAGIDIGYELYHKSSDHISFNVSSAVDCLGNTEPLSSRPISQHTQVTSHKIRGEFFGQLPILKTPAYVFVGGSHVFAGHNAPKETDIEVGFTWYF